MEEEDTCDMYRGSAAEAGQGGIPVVAAGVIIIIVIVHHDKKITKILLISKNGKIEGRQQSEEAYLSSLQELQEAILSQSATIQDDIKDRMAQVLYIVFSMFQCCYDYLYHCCCYYFMLLY
jgi:hypothetical protein